MNQIVSTREALFLSEIFPLKKIESLNIVSFRIDSRIDLEDGNRISFHLSRQWPGVIVAFHEGSFFAISESEGIMPNSQEWREILETLQKEESETYSHPWSYQEVRSFKQSPEIISRLAVQILRVVNPFERSLFFEKNNVQIKQRVRTWPEIFQADISIQAAISLSIRSQILFAGTLQDFYINHPQRQNPKELLENIKVQDIDSDSGNGTVVGIAGSTGELRQSLIEKATGSTSKRALREAEDNQPVVEVKFGKGKKSYYYPLAALRPKITENTADRFNVQYGHLLKRTKISYEDRKKILSKTKQEASSALSRYGLSLLKSINNSDYPSSFLLSATDPENIPLLFGNNYTSSSTQILKGLKNGGVYRKHPDYKKKEIYIAVVKLVDSRVNKFVLKVIDRFRQYKFQSEVIHRIGLNVESLDAATARVKLEKIIDDICNFPIDIVLFFLPESDRASDEEAGGSFYQLAYSRLLRRKIASQFIYYNTLKQNPDYVLNQVIPGMLAKLGNLPFILSEPLNVADCFIGLDVSRISKKYLPGSLNACASIRLYGKQGEFIHYRLEDGLIEGEEIPQRLIEQLTPASELGQKNVLIYRDGLFRGSEVEHLLKRAEAIDSKFILVECRKDGVPRLYEYKEKAILSPPRSLSLCLSKKEAILVTTAVSEKVGLSRPLRLSIHERGHQAEISDVLDATLKLTLLHHGALKSPRLPMPLYGADRLAYLRLRGIYPGHLEGDRQFWL